MGLGARPAEEPGPEQPRQGRAPPASAEGRWPGGPCEGDGANVRGLLRAPRRPPAGSAVVTFGAGTARRRPAGTQTSAANSARGDRDLRGRAAEPASGGQ